MNFIAGEDTFFKVKKSLNCRGNLLDLSTPLIMGILNITPDSFYDGGQFPDENSSFVHAEIMLSEGTDIIDIGGQSSRPGAKRISAEEEWNRIGKTVKQIHQQFPDVIISIDTFYSSVAAKAIDEGASIINDISAGSLDSSMHSFIAERKVPYIIMHMQGTPENMQKNPSYENVVSEVMQFFIDKVKILREKNIHDIIIDPGFGFGKTVEHNYSLLKNLPVLKMLDCPVLAGLSRKSMITKVLDVKPVDALNGTITLNTIALINGASILRVHDVAQAVEVKKIICKYLQSE